MAEAGASDEALVASVRRGHTQRFAELVHRHHAIVYSAARAILHDGTEAEDVAQEAYVRAFEHLGAFEGRASFRTWLVRIATHEALARARARRRMLSLDALGLDPPAPESARPTPETCASDIELHDMLAGAISGLPAGFGAVFVMRAVLGLSPAEVSRALGLRECTVRTRLCRAYRRLREALRRQNTYPRFAPPQGRNLLVRRSGVNATPNENPPFGGR